MSQTIITMNKIKEEERAPNVGTQGLARVIVVLFPIMKKTLREVGTPKKRSISETLSQPCENKVWTTRKMGQVSPLFAGRFSSTSPETA